MRCNEPSIHDLHAEFKAMSLAFVGKKEEVAAAPAGKVRVTRRSLLAGAAGLIASALRRDYHDHAEIA